MPRNTKTLCPRCGKEMVFIDVQDVSSPGESRLMMEVFQCSNEGGCFRVEFY